MRKTKSTRVGILLCAIIFCGASVGILRAQIFNDLVSFGGTNGGNANGPLVQGFDGNFYGTTPDGGTNGDSRTCLTGCGTIFKLTPGGTLTVLYNFCSQSNCADGAVPSAGLVLASNGNLYGTTSAGGAYDNPALCGIAPGCGTVFVLTPAGDFRVLRSFCAVTNCVDGSGPAGLMQAANGNFYGVTGSGGYLNDAIGCSAGCGTVFEMLPDGKLDRLHSFCSQGNCNDGQAPAAALIQGSNGILYGTTTYGGSGSSCPLIIGCGTVFEVKAGQLQTLYNFCSQANCADGQTPIGSFAQDSKNRLYGATIQGGTHGNGTVYAMTAAGSRTTVYNFCAHKSGMDCIDGSSPQIALGTDGNLYGATTVGGDSQASALCQGFGCGTVFRLTLAGKLTTLYAFCPQTDCLDGAYPTALMQATDGTFYGPAAKGGADFSGCYAGGGCGAIYSESVGLSPFVTANPNAGWTGRTINILGSGLSGTTSVSFNGVAATFTVVSSTQITAMVPAGTTSGSIEVTTPSGTLKSNSSFRAIP